MDLFTIISVLITLSAIFGYINHRYIKLPATIGSMLIALVMSLTIILSGKLGLPIGDFVENIISSIDFNKTLMVGMLSFLLFAGALHVDINNLSEKKLPIAVFSTFGVLLSTFIVGSTMYLVLKLIGFDIRYIYCLLFGSLISPTDPIAVLGILKQAGASKGLETKITGESLFNDGVGVVVFIVILELATSTHGISPFEIATLFAKEALGGIVFGLFLGYSGYLLLKSINNYQVEIMITLAMVTSGYAFALWLHLSGPIAIVVAGLLIGNHGRQLAMSDTTREHLDTFWELIDEILNSILFVLIGLELLILTLSGHYIIAGLIAIPVAIAARFISIGIPVSILKYKEKFSPNIVKVMTWGGLRGGISVALALSIPQGYERDLILTMTYTVVIFSIVVQGLTIKYLVQQKTD